MKLAGRLGWAVAAALIVLVVLLSASRLPTSRAVAIWLVVLTALALVALLRHTRESGGAQPASRFERALRKEKPSTAQPEELLRMEREILLGIAEADHAHRRLLPLLRAAAAARLAGRHGLELERRPGLERRPLGEDVWELLRPDRPLPQDRHARGVPREQVVAAIERIEAL